MAHDYTESTGWLNKSNRPEKATAKGIRVSQSRTASTGGRAVNTAPNVGNYIDDYTFSLDFRRVVSYYKDMELTLATRYTVTRDPESEYPELAGLSSVIIVNDPISDSEYALCVWGNGASVEQELNSASSVTGFTEIGSVRADLEEITEAITDDAYRAWMSMNSTHDGSPRRTTMAMAKDLCEEFVLNTIEVAQGVRDITQDVIADLVETA